MRITKSQLKSLIENYLKEQEDENIDDAEETDDTGETDDTAEDDGNDESGEDQPDEDDNEDDADDESGSFEDTEFSIKLENGKKINVNITKNDDTIKAKIIVDDEDMSKSFTPQELSALIYARLTIAIQEGRKELESKLIACLKEIQTDLKDLDDEQIKFKLKSNARRFHLQWFKDIVERLS